MNFLIDECLHTSLVEVAVERGHEATHVNYRGLSGVQDWNLMAPIREGQFTQTCGRSSTPLWMTLPPCRAWSTRRWKSPS